jgi:hypothetical protein
MIAVLNFRPAADPSQFQAQAEEALRLLGARPGFVKGMLGRSLDDEDAWALITEWESVGAYRRGLGGYEVKLVATPFLAQALDQPSAFEELAAMSADGTLHTRESDRATDANWATRQADS